MRFRFNLTLSADTHINYFRCQFWEEKEKLKTKTIRLSTFKWNILQLILFLFYSIVENSS